MKRKKKKTNENQEIENDKLLYILVPSIDDVEVHKINVTMETLILA